jgi:predicted membrane chloride channel (bestrophin family)
MRALRILFAGAALAVLVSLVAAVALAAPGALSPSRGAVAAEYCAPGVKQQRQAAVAAANAQLQRAARALAQLRTAQAKAKAAYVKKLAKQRLTPARRAALLRAFVRRQQTTYRLRAAGVTALRNRLRAAQATLARCD